MAMSLERLGLRFNPFEPSASGAPIGEDLWLPPGWRTRLQQLLNLLSRGQGVKALAIAGEYGGGKTVILQWLCRYEFPNRRISPFYFDNPGVQFYDLANSLLRQVGRKNFAKLLWELAAAHVGPYQRSLFVRGFEEYLRGHQFSRQQGEVLGELQRAILTAEITSDEEIAHRLARIVAETPIRPYFEYRDFVAGKRDTLVAEREEAPYFSAILKALRLAANINAVGFLVDEFEEVSLQKRLTSREAHDYLATLKRLINLTTGEDLWVVLAMTPDAVQKTQMLEPALWDRFTGQGHYQFEIQPLRASDAIDLVRHRLSAARSKEFGSASDLFPFPDDFSAALTPATVSNPRRVVKVCFYAISGAEGTSLPFTHEYLRAVENQVYPAREMGVQR